MITTIVTMTLLVTTTFLYISHTEIEMVWSYKVRVNPIIKLNWWKEIKNTYWCSLNYPLNNCVDLTSTETLEWPTLKLNGQ